jgi:UDP-N-acetylmuramoyl-L-alanyl-D-glutamate--2,6-diaminopimelate ligase
MILSKLLNNIKVVTIIGSIDVDVKSICFDSREVKEGSVFVAVKGSASDGHDFISNAIELGAVAIVCEVLPAGTVSATIVQVEDSHKALGFLATNYYNNPSEKLKLVGITGTNGKTTTVTLLYQLFTKLGYKCGLLSTIANFVFDKRVESTHTTPDPLEINSLLSQMVFEGCEYCFMEVSSHSLDQNRVWGLNFIGAIFSNITHDHLDYHKTFQEYIRVKKSFFDNLNPTAFALTNIDDKNGLIMLQNTVAKKYRYSCHSPADFNCRIIEKGLDGMLVKIDNREVWTKFIGAHNAYNLLAIYSTAILLGADKEEVLVHISSLTSVSGRLEYLKGFNDLTAVVDYAHTPDALENVLKTLSDCAGESEIVTVFGCGGNRDKTKRPEMAQISAKYSHKVIVTSDNPRFEEPDAIIEDIKAGFTAKERASALFISDREQAIKAAILMAKKGSIILVAGKGHEDYQDIKGVKHHFDDKEVISEVFNQN